MLGAYGSGTNRTSVSSAAAEAGSVARKALNGDDSCPELERLRENIHTGGASPSIVLTRTSMRNCTEGLRDAVSVDGFPYLTVHYLGVLQDRLSRIGNRQITDLERQELTAIALTALESKLIEAYLAAYFRDGDILAVDLDSKQLRSQAEAAIKKAFPKTTDPEVIKKLVDQLLESLVSTKADENGIYHLLLRQDKPGFVTRAGGKYVFPGVTVTIDPLKEDPLKVAVLDLSQVGAEVVRVFIEAMGDAWALVPGNPDSTGVKAGILPRYDPMDSVIGKVKEQDYGKINDWSGKAETAAGNAAGQLIRGISWISLNNEALAKAIETAIGVSARKATEKFSWCLFACQAQSLEIASTLAPRVARITVEVRP